MSKNTQSEAIVPAMVEKKPIVKLKSINLQVFVMLAAIVVIMLFFTFTTEGAYLSARNISNLLRQTAITGILAVGMVFVIVSAEIDLSVGSMMGLLGGAAAIFDVWLGWPLPLTIVVTLLAGLLLGAWNGWWVAYRKVPSFIVTLAGMLAFRGILIGITNGTTVAPTSGAMSQIGQSYLPNGLGFGIGAVGLMLFVAWQWRRRSRRAQLGLPVATAGGDVTRQSILALLVLGAIYLLNDYRGVPTPVLILTALMLAGIFMATRTAFGRRIYAIGGNIDAARLSGVNVERTKLAVFAINGLMVAIAGLILSSRLGAGSPSAGNIAELDAIAACVIGGTSLAGGIGSVAGAVMGAFIMASLDNGMSMLDVPTFWQYIVKGAILLLAVWMDSATKRRA
ncbi:Xylose transport system permease protein xylH [Serratia quinivorans]|jgi:D-xylose transport system permease protein|uniref:xylose ABC transporter permease XylH n=1 Tax=Serratia quinivorans TaxID=137545 RepID=UPI002178E31D|nr:xylose ABC transporter permease XylH [Serratia quinivorans]CAI1059001.1 Xylose transport system permease protein xylH [Serratia quinivorans]CAI1108726.1 Xylose transport system permease protein xylH [Serratia quinivorans]CAI1165919.1 Xylose transport system permease protein xylH [Serratia quinivorans]CAI1816668.1 Xylose transport system permease protein xylH [Serratia quinivorans]CAI1856861.1 Xylose transport system permease protein xylH [Serratia quinivorans]